MSDHRPAKSSDLLETIIEEDDGPYQFRRQPTVVRRQPTATSASVTATSTSQTTARPPPIFSTASALSPFKVPLLPAPRRKPRRKPQQPVPPAPVVASHEVPTTAATATEVVFKTPRLPPPPNYEATIEMQLKDRRKRLEDMLAGRRLGPPPAYPGDRGAGQPGRRSQ